MKILSSLKGAAVAAVVLCSVASAFAADKYEATWESLNSRPCPQWWKDAKFGIFIHWGVYCVPAFAPTDAKSVYDCYAEWYGGKLGSKKTDAYREHQAEHFHGKSYPDLAAEFTAKDFKAADWAALFRAAGAKYVVLTSKHHEGFPLWKCTTSPYFNATVMGPKRDICGELSEAVKAAGLHMGFYYSLLEWKHPLYCKERIDEFVEKVNLPQLHELVESYRPDIVWTDGEWDYPWETWRGPEFLTWLYNESPVKDTVVANDRWGKSFRGKCGDHYTTEYGDGEWQKEGSDNAAHPWEECRGIGRSFGYNRYETLRHYMSNEACVESLCEKVSRGGNLLLNIGPDANGQIPVVMEERLMAMGAWLKVNGEAIYGTTAWKGRPKNMKKDRIYYTAKGDAVYAIVFGSPEKFTVAGLKAAKSVRLLGSEKKVDWEVEDAGLEIEMPAFRQGAAPCEHALAFEIR